MMDKLHNADTNGKRKIITKKIVLSGLFLALALIVSLIESLIPPLIPVLPYAKIGLGNIILLACFLTVGVAEGYIVLALRCLLNAVFAANMAMMIWSLPSALVAYTVMILLYKTKKFSVLGVSVAGGMLHNFVQICVASIVVGQSVFAYLPYMLLAGGLAGICTGLLCFAALKVVERIKSRNVSGEEIEKEIEAGDSEKNADIETDGETSEK